MYDSTVDPRRHLPCNLRTSQDQQVAMLSTIQSLSIMRREVRFNVAMLSLPPSQGADQQTFQQQSSAFSASSSLSSSNTSDGYHGIVHYDWKNDVLTSSLLKAVQIQDRVHEKRQSQHDHNGGLSSSTLPPTTLCTIPSLALELLKFDREGITLGSSPSMMLNPLSYMSRRLMRHFPPPLLNSHLSRRDGKTQHKHPRTAHLRP